ncbi:MAG: DUF6391 domain-containing protein [Chloroflexota bacterium]|nr:DUF6391 domain-containing protein [Chloroflexota bacterium]
MLLKLARRIRRNHALEHATINLLSHNQGASQTVGISGPRGFTLYTNLTLEEVYPAVQQALAALQNGQAALAIHPNCGTNLLTTALLTTVATMLGLHGKRKQRSERVENFLQLVLLNALILILSRPVGFWVQENLTVDSHVQDVKIAAILSHQQGNLQRIEVQTAHG